MRDPNEATIESQSEHPGTRAAPVACIDLDRFCEGCAYNLRTLPVYRDERTGIPVVRCPECGRFQSANDASTALHPWLNRATSVLLVGWMLAIIAGFILLGMAEGSLSYATLDEFTTPGGSRVEQIGISVTRIFSGYGPLEVRTDYPEYTLVVTLMLACSLAIAFVGGMVAAVVFPHWRKTACGVPVLGLPIAAGVIVALTWTHEAPHLFDWGMRYVGAHAGVQLFGGLAGIIFGRPLARLGVWILLPPSVRPRLAFLWLTDDKPIPGP